MILACALFTIQNKNTRLYCQAPTDGVADNTALSVTAICKQLILNRLIVSTLKMTRLTNSNHDFREDINGLRAWAVLVVVMYHFGVVGFQGGFQGVDIFFVISGYLMTKIIVSGLENPAANYSVRQFYLSRAIRIIPALLYV